MKNYKRQNACANCKHCYIYIPYDDPYYYYCDVKGDRPTSRMENEFNDLEIGCDEWQTMLDAWWNWSTSGKEVSAHGICDLWEGGWTCAEDTERIEKERDEWKVKAEHEAQQLTEALKAWDTEVEELEEEIYLTTEREERFAEKLSKIESFAKDENDLPVKNLERIRKILDD